MVSMAQWRLRTLGHVAAVLHSEYEGAMGRGRGGCCQWTAVPAKKEEVAEIEANIDGSMTTCRSGGLREKKEQHVFVVRARGSDRRSGCVLKELYSKNVVPKVELRQLSRTRAVEVLLAVI